MRRNLIETILGAVVLVWAMQGDEVQGLDTEAPEPYALFSDLAACPVQGVQAMTRAEQSAEAALAKSERYPFDAADGLDSAALYDTAYICYQSLGQTAPAQEMLRERGLTVGRLDSRYLGQEMDRGDGEMRADPAHHAAGGAFTSLANEYLRTALGVVGAVVGVVGAHGQHGHDQLRVRRYRGRQGQRVAVACLAGDALHDESHVGGYRARDVDGDVVRRHRIGGEERISARGAHGPTDRAGSGWICLSHRQRGDRHECVQHWPWDRIAQRLRGAVRG